jgi:phytoene dehydrogenase-like protein
MSHVDVAIVGGGIGGLTTAFRLPGLDVAVLERAETVGGRARMAPIAGELVPRGAVFTYLDTPTEALCGELGIDLLPVVPETYSCFFRGRTVIARSDDELVDALPVGPEAKRELATVIARMRDDYARYAETGHDAAGEVGAGTSFADTLADLSSEARELFAGLTFAHTMARADEVSATYALRYLASYVFRDAAHRAYPPPGLEEIPRRLAASLGSVVRLGTHVETVERAGGDFALQTTREGRSETLTARRVVMAVPGPEVEQLVLGLPDWKRDAIARVPTDPSLILNAVIEPTPGAAWRDVFYLAAIGTEFDYVLNPRVGPAFDPDGPAIFQIGAWKQRAQTAFSGSDEEITRAWLDDLERIFPGIGARVAGTALTRWPHCFAMPRPDREARLPLAKEPVDGLHFVGDYASSTAGTHGVIAAAERAAAEIRAGR